MKTKNLIAFFVSSTIAGTAASAVIWDESTQGDVSPAGYFNLQTGSNEIRGTFSFQIDEANGLGFTRDSDAFRFNLSQGLSLDSYDLTIIAKRVLDAGNVTVATAQFRVNSDFPNSPAVYSSSSSLPVPDMVRSETGLGLTGQTGFFTASFRGFGHPSSVDGAARAHVEYDYIATALVSGTAVPLPGAAWLFISGIVALASFRSNTLKKIEL